TACDPATRIRADSRRGRGARPATRPVPRPDGGAPIGAMYRQAQPPPAADRQRATPPTWRGWPCARPPRRPSRRRPTAEPSALSQQRPPLFGRALRRVACRRGSESPECRDTLEDAVAPERTAMAEPVEREPSASGVSRLGCPFPELEVGGQVCKTIRGRLVLPPAEDANCGRPREPQVMSHVTRGVAHLAAQAPPAHGRLQQRKQAVELVRPVGQDEAFDPFRQ